MSNVIDNGPILNDLKDKHKGKDCLLMATGPSLGGTSRGKIYDFALGKVVACVKQSYHLMQKRTDYHFFNCSNLPVPTIYGHYHYLDDFHPVVIASTGKTESPFQVNQHVDIEFKVPLYNDLEKDTVMGRCDFDNWTFDKTLDRPCGPGIMYETVLYSLIHMGIKRIFAIGWDLSNLYKQEYCESVERSYRIGGNYRQDEIKLCIDKSKELYEWLLSKGVELYLISNRSRMHACIPRYTI